MDFKEFEIQETQSGAEPDNANDKLCEQQDSPQTTEDFVNSPTEGLNVVEDVEDEDNVEGGKILEHKNILKALLSELKPINFQEIAGLSGEESLNKRHYVVISIEQIIEVAKKKHWSLCVSESMVYIYNGAYWKELMKDELLHFLGLAAEALGVDAYIARYYTFRDELLKQFVCTAYLPKPERTAEEVLINLANGTFVVRPDGQFLRDFNRQDFLTYQLSFEMEVKKETLLFQKYLDRVLPDKKQQQVLAEFLGYVFLRQKTLKLEKAVILYGEGANGKSVFFDIVQALFSKESVSNYSLQTLTDVPGYYRARLTNKLINYASEISPRMESTMFKQLVSGEPVEARLPYGQPFILEDYAKLIFNTNQLPQNVEHNEAFFRRFILINFSVTIPEPERDPELASKIIASELPGIFNWVLEGLERVLKQKSFSQSEAVDKAITEYKQQSDTVQQFLGNEGYEKSTSKEIFLKTLYAEYKKYCDQSGERPCTSKAFSERLRRLGYILERKSNGNVVEIQKIMFKDASPASSTTSEGSA